jgi:hypothetical protein
MAPMVVLLIKARLVVVLIPSVVRLNIAVRTTLVMRFQFVINGRVI